MEITVPLYVCGKWRREKYNGGEKVEINKTGIQVAYPWNSVK